MKKLFVGLTTLMLSIGVCHATSDGVTCKNGTWRPSNEISISYGRVSLAGCVYTIGGIFGTVFSFGLAAPLELSTTGAIGLEYMNYVHPNVAVGGLVTYELYNLGFKTYSGKDEEGNSIYRDGDVEHYNIVSILPVAKFPWVAFNHVSLYSKVAAGLMITSKSGHCSANEDGIQEVTSPSTTYGFTCQICPVGVDFGNTNHRGFVELGFGAQGLILAGYRVAF